MSHARETTLTFFFMCLSLRKRVQETTLTFFVMYLSIRKPIRFTFWLTFFQSDMLLLFFSGLFSYLVGMKRTSRHVPCKKDNSHFLHCVLISPEAKILCRP